MAQFRYVAYTHKGEERRGLEEADSETELASRLQQRRLVLVQASRLARAGVSLGLTERLVGELAALLEGGMVLDRALQVLAEEKDGGGLAQVADKLRDGLKRGQSLSQALVSTGRFDPLVIPLVRAGEASGQLGRTLLLLEAHYAARRRMRAELLAALSYPAVLTVVSILSLAGLGVYVVPVFRDLFAEDLEQLPAATRLVFAVSDFLLAHGAVVLAGIVVVLLSMSLALRLAPGLRLAWHALLLRLPVGGPLLALAEGGRLMKVLGVLLERDVPLAEALELAREGVGNRAQQAGIGRAVQALRQGKALPVAMTEVPALPSRALQLLRVGDESGRLATACVKAGERLEQQLSARVKTLVAMAEPAIILVMGGLVGFVVVSMLLAVFSLSQLATPPAG